MADSLHDFILDSASRHPDATAVKYRDERINYRQLADLINRAAQVLLHLGLGRGERVAVYAEKRIETAVALFATVAAGGVFVPINPLLKGDQVGHILVDCGVCVLITTTERLPLLTEIFRTSQELHTVVVVGQMATLVEPPRTSIVSWDEQLSRTLPHIQPHRTIDVDVAAILYTSGSTGRPKGVVLSHRNIVAGAKSVAEYLQLTNQDRLLAVLPLSFDYGLNQLTTAFLVGGCAVLMNYLFPRDVVHLVAKETITGLAGVPSLWIQLAQLEWPVSVNDHLRYFTSSGGPMPATTLAKLRLALPNTKPYLMYGLTEAFRSTYLEPEEVDRRPDSIGKAIPNAEILVLREDGSRCAPNEPGELVHRGALVSLGYWNDMEKTAQRFRPVPGQGAALPLTEIAVWSGDTVRTDEDGFFYFVGRRDEMIKTSGYRVSPSEIEEIIYAMKDVAEVAAMGVEHPVLGQAIAVVATPANGSKLTVHDIMSECQRRLPAFMVPAHVEISRDPLPRSPNGKIDRKQLALERRHLFETL